MPSEQSEARRVVLDEDINWKLSIELRRRGFGDATSLKELGLANKSLKDGQLIKRLTTEYEPCVLVVWDNKMVYGHRQELEHFRLTIAIVDQQAKPEAPTDEEYYRDVIHRHVHRFTGQERGTAWKYAQRSLRIRML